MNIDFKNVGKHYAARTHEKMQEVLMDPNGVGPTIHYYMIRGGKDQKNITVWEPGTISGEYIKTYGHYHVGKLDETYWIIFGTGINFRTFSSNFTSFFVLCFLSFSSNIGIL